MLLACPLLVFVLHLPPSCCLPVCRFLPPGAASPPPGGFCFVDVGARVAWCFAVLRAVLCDLRCPALCCALPWPFVLRVLRGAALCFLPLLPPAVFLNAAPFAPVLCLVGFCCVCCAVLYRLMLFWAAVCCVVSVGAMWCCLCCVARRCFRCCAVMMCVVLCLLARCLVVVYRDVRVASCRAVLVCFSVSCAFSLGAVLRRVACCFSVRCSAVVHCIVYVVLCCFFLRFLVLLRAVPCRWGLYALLCAVLCCCVLCCA